MASPPFDINASIPADNDIVSQHPTGARAFRDIVESWFLIEGNVSGRSNKRVFDYQSPAPSGVASTTTVYADDLGYLMIKRASGSAMYLEEAPGTLKNFAGTVAPEGWLLAYGQAISRTTYARLFATIGITYGAGDSATTFNVPDLRGRVLAGSDNMGGVSASRMTGNVSGSIIGTGIGNAGGNEGVALTEAQLPIVTPTGAIAGSILNQISGPVADGGTGGAAVRVTALVSIVVSTFASIVMNAFGSGTQHNNVQPTLVVNTIIKF